MQNTWLENKIIKKIKNFLLPPVDISDAGRTISVNDFGEWSITDSPSSSNYFNKACITVHRGESGYQVVGTDDPNITIVETSFGGSTIPIWFKTTNPSQRLVVIGPILYGNGRATVGYGNINQYFRILESYLSEINAGRTEFSPSITLDMNTTCSFIILYKYV